MALGTVPVFTEKRRAVTVEMTRKLKEVNVSLPEASALSEPAGVSVSRRAPKSSRIWSVIQHVPGILSPPGLPPKLTGS